MKRIITAALVLAMLTALLAGCGGSKGKTVEDIKKAGKLVMGTDAAWAPFEYIADSDTPVGSDIDLAQAIADQWGVELEIINAAFDTLPQYLDNGTVDIVIAAMTITEERKEQMAFSDPYTVSVQYIIVKEEDSSVQTIEDLAGKRRRFIWAPPATSLSRMRSPAAVSGTPAPRWSSTRTLPRAAWPCKTGAWTPLCWISSPPKTSAQSTRG